MSTPFKYHCKSNERDTLSVEPQTDGSVDLYIRCVRGDVGTTNLLELSSPDADKLAQQLVNRRNSGVRIPQAECIPPASPSPIREALIREKAMKLLWEAKTPQTRALYMRQAEAELFPPAVPETVEEIRRHLLGIRLRSSTTDEQDQHAVAEQILSWLKAARGPQ